MSITKRDIEILRSSSEEMKDDSLVFFMDDGEAVTWDILNEIYNRVEELTENV